MPVRTSIPTAPSAAAGAEFTRSVLVLGEPGGLGVAVATRLMREGHEVGHDPGGSDGETATAVRDHRWGAFVVVSRNDVESLRLAMLCAHLRPDAGLVVTLFDRTVSRELEAHLPAARVVSPAELVAVEIAEMCVGEGIEAAPRWRSGVGIVDDALRLALVAAAGLAGAIGIEAAASAIALHEGPLDALYLSVRTATTVAAAPEATTGPGWFKVVSIANMLVCLTLLAVFTAALVRRLSRARLTTAVGRRAAPSRRHVIVVGFGQIGYRLAEELQSRGIPVLGVERSPDAPCLRLARRVGIPVAIAHGDDREALEQLGVRRCAAVAAVTSDDLVNVSVGLAVADIRSAAPVLLRLGDGDVAAETDSLLHLGRICDTHHIAAEAVVGALVRLWAAAEPAGRPPRAPEVSPAPPTE